MRRDCIESKADTLFCILLIVASHSLSCLFFSPSQPSHFRPSTGVDAFLNIHNQYYKEIASGYELWIQKTDQQPFNSTKIKQYKITEEPAAASTDAVKPKHDEL